MLIVHKNNKKPLIPLERLIAIIAEFTVSDMNVN